MKREAMQRNKDPNAMAYLDCQACVSDGYGRVGEATRAMWRCGWMDEKDRRPTSTRRDPRSWGLGPDDVCPGYLIRLPQVREAANAHAWWKEAQLQLLYKDAADADLLQWAIGQLNQALSEAETEARAAMNG